MFRSRNVTISATEPPKEVTFDYGIYSSETISIQNTHATENVYLGNSTVTYTDYGHKLKAGESLTLDISRDDKLFAAGSGVILAILSIVS
jgi:hypothetical protein